MGVPNTFADDTVADADEVNANFAWTGMVPIGSVISWLKSLTNTPTLDDRFVECNGQTLSDAESVYNGVVIPNLNGSGAITGVANSGANTTITKTSAGWTTNQFANYIIKLTSGTGSGQYRLIVSNTADTITIQGNWTTNPASGTNFSISTPQRFLRGSTTSGTSGGEDVHLMTEGEMVRHNHKLSSSGTYPGSGNAESYGQGGGADTNTTYTGGSQAFNELPSYYEVVYIMRVK